MRARRSRLPAFLLFLALVGGGFGLPLADALIFHGDPGARPAAERLLTGDSRATSHVQVCSLEHSTAAKRAVLSIPEGLVLRTGAPEPVTFHGSDRLLSRQTSDTDQSRAPPSA